MNDSEILFVKPKAISQRDKKALQEAGVIVVEVDDVNNVKFVRANSELSGTEMLIAAVKAIQEVQQYGNANALFGKYITAALKAKFDRVNP